MRLVLVAALFALAPTLASAAQPAEEDDLAVTVLDVRGAGLLVSWTPDAGALAYNVYRGPDLDQMEHVATTAQLFFFDHAAPYGNVWYLIDTNEERDLLPDYQSSQGKCLVMRGLTGISVTLANCMPGRII